MKTVSINDTLNEDFWSTGKVIMPAEAAVVNSVLRNQTDTPTILGANGGTYWAAGGKEYTISQASEITTCETEQISDADWKALLDAGYKGSIEKGNVTKAVHPTRATMGSANVSFGVALDGLTLVDLFESSAWADVQDRYYISIWLKVNVSGYNWVKTLAAFDVENKKQGYTYLINGVDYANWDTLPQDTWYELRYSLKALRNSAYGVDNGICPNDLSFGLYCYHSNLGSDATFSIYSMELMLNDAETTTSGNVDLSYAVGNPFANNYVKMQGFDIYDGETKLKAGEDYTVDGTTVNGLSAGSYKVQYNLVSSNVWNGALNAYPNGAVITRKLVVEQAYPVVIDDMSTTSSVKAYTQTHAGATFKTNECTEIISQSTTITADEYQALVDLGYKGAKTDLNAQTLTFSSYTARQNVYVQFDKTAVDERLAEVIQNKDDSVYLSIWLKSNQTYGCTTYAGIIGQTSNKVVPHNGAWKDGVAGNWFEIKIAISDLLPTSADIGDGKLSASETYAYGFVMENAHAHQLNQYLNSATFTIYSVELCKA